MNRVFSVSLRPMPVKRAGDLWRMNTQNDYVKGEEGLTNWMPRGVSLIRDYIAAKRRRQRLAELDAAEPLLSKIDFLKPSTSALANGDTTQPEEEQPLSEHQTTLLNKYLQLWKLCQDPITSILTPSNVEPPTNGVPSTSSRPAEEDQPNHSPQYIATIAPVPKNATILKGGYLLTPSADSSRWARRFVELRRPYMHIHSVPNGEEICVVSLRNSRVDHSPQIAKLLQRDRGATNGDSSNRRRGRAGERQGEDSVFAIYGTDNTWLFKARNEREKVEWIFKIDQAYFGGGSGSGSGEDDDFR